MKLDELEMVQQTTFGAVLKTLSSLFRVDLDRTERYDEHERSATAVLQKRKDRNKDLSPPNSANQQKQSDESKARNTTTSRSA